MTIYRFFLSALVLSGASLYASDASTPLRNAALESITVTKPFLVSANSQGTCFQNGQPKCDGAGPTCSVSVREASAHDRLINAKTVKATVGSLDGVDQRVVNYVAKLDVSGQTLNGVFCFTNDQDVQNGPSIADFQRAFGEYLRLDLIETPEHVDPLK